MHPRGLDTEPQPLPGGIKLRRESLSITFPARSAPVALQMPSRWSRRATATEGRKDSARIFLRTNTRQAGSRQPDTPGLHPHGERASRSRHIFPGSYLTAGLVWPHTPGVDLVIDSTTRRLGFRTAVHARMTIGPCERNAVVSRALGGKQPDGRVEKSALAPRKVQQERWQKPGVISKEGRMGHFGLLLAALRRACTRIRVDVMRTLTGPT